MNLLLLFEDDFQTDERVRLTGRRFAHMAEVLRVEVGAQLRVGRVNGMMGTGCVTQLGSDFAELEVCLSLNPPNALPLTLLLGLPRPRVLKRTLQSAAALGVKEIVLLNGYRVEKSYWQTPVLSHEGITENLVLGLEQAQDTVMPRVRLQKLFKPFVEDELPAIAAGTRALVAHPYAKQTTPSAASIQTTLAIGPEGGFIDFEVEKLGEAGLEQFHMGPRILRVETAVPSLLSRLFPVS